MATKDTHEADNLSGKKPVELRALARDLGIENPDRMTSSELIETIQAEKQTDQQEGA